MVRQRSLFGFAIVAACNIGIAIASAGIAMIDAVLRMIDQIPASAAKLPRELIGEFHEYQLAGQALPPALLNELQHERGSARLGAARHT